MLTKSIEKEKAIKLRKRGWSYKEILREVPVAKSTLSLWLRSVGLAKKQKQKLTQKKLIGALKGAEKRRKYKLNIVAEIKNKAKNEIKKISDRELWLIGIALYWAEGTREKYNSTNVKFANSDPKMIKLFLKWIQKICKIPKKDISFAIYLHETARERKTEIQKYWSKVTNFPVIQFQKIYWKKHKINTKRKNIGRDYCGLLKIEVKRSSSLTRKIAGWVEGICEDCGVV